MRLVMVRVFPVPAPASTHTGPRGAATAADCSGSNPAVIESTDMHSILSGSTDTRPPRLRGPRPVGTTEQPSALSGSVTTTESTSDESTAALTVYSTTWCGYCRRLKTQLNEAGIAYTEIDIEEDPKSAEFVGSVNGGNHIVPTVLFADGTTATNPTLAAVKQALKL